MSNAMMKAIQDDVHMRPRVCRVAEGFKQKLRTKSAAVIASLLKLKPEYELPDQSSGIILRVVTFWLIYFLF